MKIIEGQLKKIGRGSINAEDTLYPTIEINNQILKNIACKNSLSNIFESAIGQEGTTKLYIHRIWNAQYIVGVELPSNKKAAVKPQILINLTMFLIIGLCFLAVYVGIVFLILAFFELKNYLLTMKAIKANKLVILKN